VSYDPTRYDSRSFLICVDHCDDGQFRGFLHHPQRGESSGFKSLLQLIMRMEQTLDMENEPQSFNSMRTFFPPVALWGSEEDDIPFRRGRKMTLAVRVLFRYNSSWQGSLTWLEEGRTEKFRSVLELLTLVHSAVEGDWRSPVRLATPDPLVLAE